MKEMVFRDIKFTKEMGMVMEVDACRRKWGNEEYIKGMIE
jgi:hypothetical protein